MIQTFRYLATNIFYIILIGGITLVVSLYAFTKRVTNYATESTEVPVTVEKKEIHLVAQTGGKVASIEPDNYTLVEKDERILTLENPVLEEKIRLYERFSNNESAISELAQLNIEKQATSLYAPAEGVIKLDVVEGDIVNKFDTLGYVYSMNNIRLLAVFDILQYREFEEQNVKKTYQVMSPRLGKNFQVELIKDNHQIIEKGEQTYLGVYFRLKDSAEGVNLLQNEQLILEIEMERQTQNQPIHYISSLLRSVFGFDLES